MPLSLSLSLIIILLLLLPFVPERETIVTIKLAALNATLGPLVVIGLSIVVYSAVSTQWTLADRYNKIIIIQK